MAILWARGVEKSFGDRRILRGADLLVEEGDRVGLVGPNGSGKSTFLGILAGYDTPDHGEVNRTGRVGVLDQEPVLSGTTVAEAAREALAWHDDLVRDWQEALDRGDLMRAASLQDRLDVVGWNIDSGLDSLLDRLGAPPPEASVARLSGGERRRVALAVALLGSPDLLLLDEPTNHLDADAVEWLEGYLSNYRGALVLVTHDRYLLEAVANRIVEVEDGTTVAYDDASYGDYLVKRAERQMSLHRSEDRRLALIEREAAWAAKSPAARTTKQTARLKRLDELQAVRPLKREETFSLDLKSEERLGSTILELHRAHKRYGATKIFDDLTLVLAPGDRVGIVGPNGAGKTTLLRIVAGTETLDKGDFVRGSRVKFGILDQHRSGLDESKTLIETIGNGNDHVLVGDRHVHVATFLERFLFERSMFEQRVSGLSGGERARLLLATLLLKGANVLLLDEPTNDLDLMTLRVLEEALMDFDGCALVVTHDRAFLDRVCTGVLGFHGDGEVVRYADRLQYQREAVRRHAAAKAPAKAAAKSAAKAAPASAPSAPPKPRTKLTHKEQRELETLPQKIEALEAEQMELEAVLADPSTYKSRGADVPGMRQRLQGLAREVETAFARWEDLSSRA